MVFLAQAHGGTVLVAIFCLGVVLFLGLVVVVIVFGAKGAQRSPPGETSMSCPDCGRGVSQQDVFCPDCGRPLRI